MTRIYISAGEPSADAHAAAVATALRRRLPGLELEALGGQVSASNRIGGGLSIAIVLPRNDD